MRTATLHRHPAPLLHARRAPAPLFQTLVSRLVETLFAWHQRVQQRQRLAQFDDRMLRDIGVSRADVAREVGKPFWQA
jgi:uncharacterized protein YjiS (DUF1127 family)